MSTSIVIPFQHSRWNDIEIKYALRSVEKHLIGWGDVFIVGDLPKSLKGGYTHIPAKDDNRSVYKERNIAEKLLTACDYANVTDTFLWMDDDHFLLADAMASLFPVYCHLWPKRRADMYQQTIDNTLRLFPKYSLVWYNLHCPMVYEKEAFCSRIGSLDWTIKAGYCIQTVYMHHSRHMVNGLMYPDLKIKYQYPITELRKIVANRKWFSMCDGARGPELERLLEQLYPNKSRFE